MQELVKRAAALLNEGAVKGIWGYAAGTQPLIMTPYYAENVSEAANLTFNPFCYHSLPGYLKNFKQQKTAVVVKKCDLAAVNILLAEGQLDRANLHLIAMDCAGLVDLKKLAALVDFNQIMDWSIQNNELILGQQRVPLKDILLDKCSPCAYQELADYDEILSPPDKITVTLENPPAADLTWAEWQEHFSRCIQCFACRQACPMCYCTECIAEQNNPRWIPQSVGAPQNIVWQITRIMHLTGRCTGCGECERVCPAKIPLRRLTAKMRELAAANYKYLPGSSPTQELFWGTFGKDDPEKVIFHPEGK